MTQIVTNVRDEEWESFLDNYNTASICHTPNWKNFVEKTFNYESKYLFAKDECGNIVGLLPLFYVKSKLTGNRLCSVPFFHDCGYLGSKDAEDLLIGEGINLYSNLNANYFEIRDSVTYDGFQRQNSFSTYILELSNTESTWNSINKSMRRYIKKSMNSVEVVNSTCIEYADFFYEINCRNKKNKGVPSHTKQFIHNLINCFPNNVSIYLANYEKEPIGGIITLSFGNQVLYGYGASDPKFLDYHPLHACLWKSIENSCLKGFKYYDFGRVSYDNTGLVNFKKRWGTIETKLNYSYYPNNPGSLTENRENIKYKYGTKIIQKLPMTAYKRFSDLTFQHFG